MADESAPQHFKVEIAPRRPSLTQRLVGNSRDWIQGFYQSQEKDDQMYGQGFNDSIDDLVPAVMYNNARRRTSSTSSDASDSVETPISGGRVRTNSISERVAGMQVINEPTSRPARRRLDSFVGDVSDYSILY